VIVVFPAERVMEPLAPVADDPRRYRAA
jgi:hypothetical protein